MGAGKWMVVLLVAGFGAGLAAGGVTTGTVRHWIDRFGGDHESADQELVAFDDTGDLHGHRQRALPRTYSDDQGYPLQGEDDGFARAPEPSYRAVPPGHVIIWQGSQWPSDEGRGDGEPDDGGQGYAPPQPRGRTYAPVPQYAPQPPARPSVPQGGDAAASAAERAAAAAADVLAAERSSH